MAFRTLYVALKTRAEPPVTLAGAFCIPEADEGGAPAAPVAAVVICHGSDGVDGRGAFHAEALREAGFATLELDMWSARGTVRGAAGRPRSVAETLPDAFAALSFLRRQPEIDPARIAIMGFSWGGVVSLLSATRANVETYAEAGEAFAAHAAFYPVLWSYNRAPGHEFDDLTEAPVLIQAGAEDAYDTPQAVEGFLERLSAATRARIRLVVHAGATHAFDRARPDKIVQDPFAHNGAGGAVAFRYNAKVALEARSLLVSFLQDALAAE